jgi:23S rRNA (adenine2503-C2)-methyltransferase
MQRFKTTSAAFSNSLLGRTIDELKQIAGDLSLPPFAAAQIAGWLYKRRVSSVDEMTDISLKNRSLLQSRWVVGRRLPVEVQTSADGTAKYLFPTDAGCVESVYIPDRERATLCVSSQAGCRMGCRFCMTGRQGFSGQLSAGEMLNQILSAPASDTLTNVVFMGMGEPMDNPDEVLKAVNILTADYGFAWSPKRITVSSIGVLPVLQRFLEETQVHLALSLHSPFAEERLSLMPVERVWPMAAVLALLEKWDFSRQRRLSFEYICFGGLNDDIRHAAALVRLLRPFSCRVNLIRYHALPGEALAASSQEAMTVFRNYLNDKGVVATIRASRGEDILAACGMLRGKTSE